VVEDFTDYSYLAGKIDTEALLEELGIDVGFKQSQHQWMCHCPDFEGNHKHGDSSPSFGFNDEKLAYNCFVCGGGTIVELVWLMRPEMAPRSSGQADKAEAHDAVVTWLEGYADLNSETALSARIHSMLHPEEEDDTLPEIPEDNLFQYRMIHPYLYERGLTKDIIVDMQVGFDEEHAGITIPHFFMGKLVGLQRRHLATYTDGPKKDQYFCPRCELDGKKVPKYKNTSGFPKANTLYGYDRMKKYLKEEGASSVIVVESPMTALKLMSMGFNRVVATFGSFSREQGMLLLAVPTVYFWPDNDAAGYENAQRAVETLGKMTTLRIVPVVLNEKGDAADLQTADEVIAYLQAAYPSTLFAAKTSGKRLPTLAQIGR
jgi:hypothetical protein